MLLNRVLSALVGIPVVLGLSYLGGKAFAALIGIIVIVGIFEYINLIEHKGYSPNPYIIYLSAALIIVAISSQQLALLSVFMIICLHLIPVVFRGADFLTPSISFFGVFYIAWTLAHLIAIRQHLPQGFFFIILAFIITWSTDTGAYFVGRGMGKTKLSPRISPNKTVEGAVGGIVFAVVAALILNKFIFLMPTVPLTVLAVIGSIAGQLGDLAESALKRWVGVKDSGRIIPGHGGILDRFDSLIIVAPVVYYFISLFIIQ